LIHTTSELVWTLREEIEARGIATASEIDIDTLEQRMWREIRDGGGVITSWSEVGAWSSVN
jgi:hypothetical protein